MELARWEDILRSDQLIKVAGDQASSRKKYVQVDKMKAIFFLRSAYQKKYSFLLKKLRDGDNMGRDEYPVMTTLELDVLIRIEGGVLGNHQSSTYETCRGKGGRQNK